MFITFEGPEGGGKSTQIQILAERLRAANTPVLITRQPGGDELGQQLRSIMLDKSSLKIEFMAELLMMMADRAQSVKRIIQPALVNNFTVICDRYADSSVAYQGYGRGLDVQTIDALNEIATGGLTPEMTFLLDINPNIGLERQSNKTRMEAESLEFHNRVREGYLSLAEQNPARFKVINANETIDHVSSEIWSYYEINSGHRS